MFCRRCSKTVADPSRVLCPDCEALTLEAVLFLSRRFGVLQQVAARTVTLTPRGPRAQRVDGGMPVRAGAFDLIREIEREMRLAAAVCGFDRAHDRRLGVPLLAAAVIGRPDPMLTASDEEHGDAADWADGFLALASRVRTLTDRTPRPVRLADVAGFRGSAVEVSRALAAVGVDVPASTIRTWVRRQKIRRGDDGRVAARDVIKTAG